MNIHRPPTFDFWASWEFLGKRKMVAGKTYMKAMHRSYLHKMWYSFDLDLFAERIADFSTWNRMSSL